MANPGRPATRTPEQPLKGVMATQEQVLRFKEVTAELVLAGRSPAEIGRALHSGNRREARNVEKAIRMMVRKDDVFQNLVALGARGLLVEGLGDVVRALLRRAKRGNPQAIKLVFEASGFHNPRVKHEHGGEVTIKMVGLPRPPRKVDNLIGIEEPVVDAEVEPDLG